MEERDHKKLGPELELFYIDQTVGKGLPMFLPKGAIIKRELEKFVIEEETKRGYQHVHTPDLARLELYEKSGHYPHYKDSMYAPIEIDEDKFMLRPMTCPHHFQMFLLRPRSYREAPMRIAELAQLYRYEQSGELMGLQRVRTFCLADAHIICANEEQAAEEASKALDLIEYMAGVFGLKMGEHYRFRLSLGDRANTEKYYKNDAAWEKSEDLLRAVMQKRGEKFEEAKDEAAFYGPKIDVQMKNVNGKEDTAFTVQYDFCMPDRFDLAFVGEDGKPHRAFVVHRSSIGAIERIMAFLIEHYGGAFPTWLSPLQATVLSVSDKHAEYAEDITQQLKDAGIRALVDTNNETLGKKVRNAKEQKVPYLLVVGDEELKNKTATLESRVGKEGALAIPDIISKLKKEIESRS
jgi:threonyl-tRNA synthetase